MKRVPLFEENDAKLKDIVDAKLKKLSTDYPYTSMKEFGMDKDFFRDIADSIIDEYPEYHLDRHHIMSAVAPDAGDYFAHYIDTLLEKERKHRVEFVGIDEL